MTDNTINNDMTMGGATGTLLAGRYRVVRQLGQGGMGSVWLAEDTKLDGFQVAIKMLPSVLVNNKRAYRQLKAEALVSLKLSHSNIATVRAFEEEGGSPFLVMDYIDGQTLDDYLAEKDKLTEEETVKLLKPVAAALDYAHTQGVVHRDVKPANIMIRKDGHPFILDFGIAREIQETMTRVTGKLSSGTLLYMSPEQLNGDAPKPAQDIYSFAAMAYECLKGEPPFSRGGVEDQIKHKTPEALGPQFIKCGPGVIAGLAKSPEARPATCAAVLLTSGWMHTVASALATGTHAPRDHADGGALSGKSRIAAKLLAVMALALAVAVGGGWWLGRCDGEKSERIESVKEPTIAKVAPRADNQSQGKVGKAASKRLVTDGSKPGDTKVITLLGGTTMEMVWCPPGNFLMGSPESEDGRGDDEAQHLVTLTKGFWMGKYEVTQGQWKSVMEPNSSCDEGANYPAGKISWRECQEFIKKINAGGLIRVKLPTEAQWEYACRAGTKTSYSSGDILNVNEANFGDYLGGVSPVGSYMPNAWGLFDMHGNVMEWCMDFYDKNYGKSPSHDPLGGESPLCYHRVCRGGSYLLRAQWCRSACRNRIESYGTRPDLGFRLVCDAECARNELGHVKDVSDEN